MKKQLLFVTLVFTLLMGNAFAQTVYITKTGKKYHSEYCRYLSKSSNSISLDNAKARGYNACSVCKPINVKSIPFNAPIKENHNRPTNQSYESVQCSATTKAGSQCKRITKSSNGKCWQHGGN